MSARKSALRFCQRLVIGFAATMDQVGLGSFAMFRHTPVHALAPVAKALRLEVGSHEADDIGFW